jgi:hypothetical protein
MRSLGFRRSARDRQHLLLAAGKLSPLVGSALGERRESLVDPSDGPCARPLDRRQQVLLDREIGEDAPALRHVADAHFGDPVGRAPGRLDAEDFDASLPRPVEADQVPEGSRLARPVASEQRDDLALAHLE